jgi:hypothetical protein
MVAAVLAALALGASGCTIQRVMAVGDTCASGSSPECAQVAQVIRDQHPNAFLHLGDMQYPDGSQAAFEADYARIFADLHAVTYPVFGATHDFAWSGYPVAFMNVHSAAAGKLHDDQWGYSFDLGPWHVVALDYDHPDPAALEADLAAHPSHCLMAIDHAPYFGTPTTVHPTNELTRAFVEPLFRHGVDLMLTAHNHVYERMAPQDIDRNPDPNGPVAFQVGTGGIGHYAFKSPPAPNSVVRSTSAFGALELSLYDEGWSSRYVDAPGSDLVDNASGDCGPS